MKVTLLIRYVHYFFNTVVHHPAKFDQNRSRTFDIIERQTHRHKTDTMTPMKIIPVQKQSFWARLLEIL